MTDQTARMHKGVDLWAVVALGLGTAVGVAIFSVIAPATALAGPGMLLAVVVAAVPMFVIAMTYAFMGSALPTSGASFEWSRRFVHPFVGYLIAWMRIVSNVGAMLILALVMVRYLSMVIPLPTKPTMLAAFVIFFFANYFGVGLAARLQVILMGALVVLFIVFSAWGAPHVQAAQFEPFLPNGTAGMLAAIPLLIGLFFGIEAATEIGDEVKDSQKTIPLGIGLSILTAVALYLMVGAVAMGVIGPEALAKSETPLLDAAQPFMGPVAKPLIVCAAVIAIAKSINSLYLGFSRSLFAMAREGMLPAALAKVHPKYGTPHMALATILGATCLGLLAPMNLTSLFLAVNIPTLLKYAATCIAATVVVRKHPDIYEGARFKLSKGATVGWAYAGCAASLVVAVLGFSADWTPYAALAVWAAIGVAYYAVSGRQRAAAA